MPSLIFGTGFAYIIVEGNSSSNLKSNTMEALLNDFGRVFLLELMMICAIAIGGCYTTYTDGAAYGDLRYG